MRTSEEIEDRLRDWGRAKAQFFPEPIFTAVFDSFEELLGSFIAKSAALAASKARFWKRFNERIANQVHAKTYRKIDRGQATEYISGFLAKEIDWINGRAEGGALKLVVWDFLLIELHDAECAMRREGRDIVLEGKGNRPDSVHQGRWFRFWLRLRNARFDDERSSKSPIEVIWLLWGKIDSDRFVLDAQDNTLSGSMTFSGDDYDYRMWDHVASSGEDPAQ